MAGSSRLQGAPFVVAHRVGNDLARLEHAQRLAVRLVEADVHLYAGRLEVRHLKTLGPVPILWDRWRLVPPWAPRLLLDRLLGALAPGTELMLDLKGQDPRLPRRVAAVLAAAPARSVTVCSRNWRHLAPFEAIEDVRVVHSIGSRRQLARLLRLFAGRRLEGVSIHRRLLSPESVAALKSVSAMIMTWPVETADEARRLAALGVDGVISQNYEALLAR